MVDAANFLYERGWVLDKAYSSSYSGSKSIKHWVFYKDANEYEDVKEGLVTKKEYKEMKREEKAIESQE